MIPSATPNPRVDELIAVLHRLRAPGGCAWDREQTHASLVRYLVEETYELVEAIESGDDAELVEELGDVGVQGEAGHPPASDQLGVDRPCGTREHELLLAVDGPGARDDHEVGPHTAGGQGRIGRLGIGVQRTDQRARLHDARLLEHLVHARVAQHVRQVRARETRVVPIDQRDLIAGIEEMSGRGLAGENHVAHRAEDGDSDQPGNGELHPAQGVRAFRHA